MNCPKCGTDAGTGKFCPECGAPLTAPEAPAQKEEPVTLAPEQSTVFTPPMPEQMPVQSPVVEDTGKKSAKIKKRIGCLGVIVLVVLVIVFSAIASSNKMTDTEKAQVTVVVDSIDTLVEKDELSVNDKDAIEGLIRKYNELNEKQQKKVKNHKKLEKAEKTVQKLLVKQAEDAISAIGTVTVESGSAINKAWNCYNKLDGELQTQVGNKDVLDAARTQYDEVSASVVVKKINEIGTVTTKSESKLKEIEKLYYALSESGKKQVTNYSEYTAAEEKLKELKEKEREQKEKERKEARIKEVQNTIKVTRFTVSRPNSAGGVDVRIVFTNKSSKTIKYATFTCLAYNAVNDMVCSEIGNKYAVRLLYTGPVNPGKSSNSSLYWENMWYNSTIAYARMTKVELTYMDGSTDTISSDEIQYIYTR